MPNVLNYFTWLAKYPGANFISRKFLKDYCGNGRLAITITVPVTCKMVGSVVPCSYRSTRAEVWSHATPALSQFLPCAPWCPKKHSLGHLLLGWSVHFLWSALLKQGAEPWLLFSTHSKSPKGDYLGAVPVLRRLPKLQLWLKSLQGGTKREKTPHSLSFAHPNKDHPQSGSFSGESR